MEEPISQIIAKLDTMAQCKDIPYYALHPFWKFVFLQPNRQWLSAKTEEIHGWVLSFSDIFKKFAQWMSFFAHFCLFRPFCPTVEEETHTILWFFSQLMRMAYCKYVVQIWSKIAAWTKGEGWICLNEEEGIGVRV
jgi:hypothetical protein